MQKQAHNSNSMFHDSLPDSAYTIRARGVAHLSLKQAVTSDKFLNRMKEIAQEFKTNFPTQDKETL
ncbi:MAG: hypothetical protein K6L73_08455 [Cellvibrionaceae bacterium]